MIKLILLIKLEVEECNLVVIDKVVKMLGKYLWCFGVFVKKLLINV